MNPFIAARYYWGRYENRNLNRKELKGRKIVLRSFPHLAFIDPTNVCPLSCPLCPTGNRSSTHPRGLMSLDIFKGIYDQIGRYLYELHLYNWGEPLLNRNIVEMAEYAKRTCNPKVVVSSNLAGLSDDWAARIVRSKIDLLNVSIDGVTQETYGKYRVGGRLEEVLRTLKVMVDVRRAEGRTRPVLRWQFIPMRHNENEIDAARKLAKKMGVEFRIHRVRLNFCDFEKKGMQQIKSEHENWMPKDSDRIRVKKRLGLENICNFLWDRVVYNWDGSLAPCCKIYTVEDVFERDPDKRFVDVWNGEAYRKAREIFSGRKAESDFICQKCVDHEGAF